MVNDKMHIDDFEVNGEMADIHDAASLNTVEEKMVDEEMANLFAAFDEVGASDELKKATLARVLGETPEVKAVAGGNSSRATRRAKWRAIRVAAIAACLALALTGGVAYATPSAYYDVMQGDSKVTLGVNCFGVTVSATSPDEAGGELVSENNLCNMRYEDSLSRAVELMEKRNPETLIAYGPQGGELETMTPDAGKPQGEGQSQDDGRQPEGGPQGDSRPQEGGHSQEDGNANGAGPQPDPREDGQPQPAEQPSGDMSSANGPNGPSDRREGIG